MPCTPSDNITLTFSYATKERLATGVIVEVGRPVGEASFLWQRVVSGAVNAPNGVTKTELVQTNSVFVRSKCVFVVQSGENSAFFLGSFLKYSYLCEQSV